MLPMFVILWYGSLYVHNLGKNYIKVNTTARSDAWSTAMANCGVPPKGAESEHLPPNMGGVGGLPGGGGATGSAVATAMKNGNIAGARMGGGGFLIDLAVHALVQL